MIPVVELIRVSTETQAAEDRTGIPSQRTTNQVTCTQHKLRIVESVELVESGTDVAQTPEMAHVLELIAQGRARGIVLAEYSRLFRPDRWGDMVVLQELDDHGAQLYLPTGPVDLGSQVGMVQASVYTLMARLERIHIRERMRRGKEEKRKRGEHVAGGIGLPLGVDYDKEKGWSYAEDIWKVRAIFDRILAGERNFAKIADDLGLSRNSIRNIATNPIYVGWRVYDKKRDLSPAGKRKGCDRRKVDRDPSEVIRVRVPLEPLVGEREFREVGKIMELKRRHALRVRGENSPLFVYRGMLRCGACGQLIYCNAKGRKSTRRHYYYCKSLHPYRRPVGTEKCGNRHMLRERLEPTLDETIAERLCDPKVVLGAVKEYNRSLEAKWREHVENPRTLEHQIQKVEAKRDRILDAFFDGTISREERDKRLAPLAADLEALTELKKVREEQPPLLDESVILEALTVFAEFAFLEFHQKRQILEALLPLIYVYRYSPKGVVFQPARLSGDRVIHSRMGS
jgi:DNA invertase Pin-like site-specific DNA recombinase